MFYDHYDHPFEIALKQVALLLRESSDLARKFYAALCNMDWTNKNGVVYGCTWRSAGGLIADMRDMGEDYMDFYCSGNEGFVDPQVACLLSKLGWAPLPLSSKNWYHSGGRNARHWNNESMDMLAIAAHEGLVAEGLEDCDWEEHEDGCTLWVHKIAADSAVRRYHDGVEYFFQSVYGMPDWNNPGKLQPPHEGAFKPCTSCGKHTRKSYPAPTGWKEFEPPDPS